MKIKNAFTLAEALMVLTIIGIVATITIPSVVSRHKQVQYVTGLKKAVKNLNEVISLNIAKGERTALSTDNLFEYLQKNMEVIRSTTQSKRDTKNMEFYSADGMRFETPKAKDSGSAEFSGIELTPDEGEAAVTVDVKNSNCGTKGLNSGGNQNAKTETPCLIIVDINGDKSPNKMTSNDEGGELSDMFLILVTDRGAFPYGAVAQSAYYGN